MLNHAQRDLLAFTDDLDLFASSELPQNIPSSVGLHRRETVDSGYSCSTGLDNLNINSPKSPTQKYKKRAPIRKWTSREDEALKSGILNYTQQGLQINFEAIAASIPGRSVKQAKERWKNSLNPGIRKGEWQTDELLQLLDLVIEHGQNWTEIQRRMSSRSMHCIKSKGRKLLGETMSKRLLKKCALAYHAKGNKGSLEKNSKHWASEEDSALRATHTEYIQQHNPDLLTGGDISTYIGSESMEVMLESLSIVCGSLGKCRPLAVVDRRLLVVCNCALCVHRLSKLNLPSKKGLTADIEKCGSEFKVAWTRDKAKTLKNTLDHKPPQTDKPKRPRRTRPKTPPSSQQPPIDESDIFDGLEVLFDSPDDIYPAYPLKCEHEIPVIDTESYYSETDSGYIKSEPTEYTHTRQEDKLDVDSFDGLFEPDQFDSFKTPLQQFQSATASSGSKAARTRKRDSGDNKSNSHLRRVDFEMDEESQRMFEQVICRQLQASKTGAATNPLLLAGGADYTEDENKDAEELLTMVRNYHRGSNTDSTNAQGSLTRKVISAFSDFFSKEQLSVLHGHMKKNNVGWMNPNILFHLDKVQLTEKQCDMRYSKSYLNPEPEEVSFDSRCPIGTYIVNFVTRVFVDVDNESKALARGSMLNKHSWKFVPSKLEALLRVYYIIPRLFRTGSAWSYIRMYRCDGTEGIFLAHYEMLDKVKMLAMIKFQDVSYRMKHILTLPPPIY